jgi:tetratricopeptide (TPR) repeat protein
MRRTLLALALVAVVLAVFWPTVGNDFVNYDDDHYIVENPFVQRGFDAESLRWAWTTTTMGNWHPLTWMSHMLDWQLYGADPAGHHATGVALHALNTALVFLVLDAMTGAAWRSALVAALFGLHPLHVESVAWASERKDVLSTCLWLLTTFAYVVWTRRPTWGRYALVALGLALGLMAKPMLVTLPATLVLLDYWPLGRLRTAGDLWARVVEKLPLYAIVVASSVGAVLAQQSVGAVGSLDVYPFAVRLGNAAIAYATYLWMTVWPFDLAIVYPHPKTVSGWRLAASLVVLAVLTALALRQRSRRPWLLVGWLWYLGTLVPLIGLVQLGDIALADRYTYVPLLGIFVAVVWTLPVLPRLVPAVAVVILVLLSARTRAQIATWRDSVSLFTQALAVEERNPVAHNNLAFALDDRGETAAAIAHLERALVLRPDYLTARVRLGNIFLAQGRLQEAQAQFAAAVVIDPTSVAALTNLGKVLTDQGRPAEAIPLHERALALDPTSAVTEVNLGMALVAQERTADALVHFDRALALDPNNASAHNNRGNMLLAMGRTDEGLRAIERALELKPAFGRAHANRAVALLLLRRPAEAWAEIHLARANGHEPPARLIELLTVQMPDPGTQGGSP